MKAWFGPFIALNDAREVVILSERRRDEIGYAKGETTGTLEAAFRGGKEHWPGESFTIRYTDEAEPIAGFLPLAGRR